MLFATRKIQKTFGITAAEYAAMKPNDGALCAICGEPMIEKKMERGTSGSSPVLDHCGKTGKIRGFIHRNCNSGIGMFLHDPVKLRKAAAYLEANNAID